MLRSQKEEVVEQVKDRFARMSSAVFLDYCGLSVEAATALRESFRAKGVEYRVYFATFVDFFLITIVLHYVGGIESTLSWAYAVVLIATASIHGMRVGAYAAVLSSLMYSFLLIAEFKGVIPHMGQNTINPAFIHEDPSLDRKSVV